MNEEEIEKHGIVVGTWFVEDDLYLLVYHQVTRNTYEVHRGMSNPTFKFSEPLTVDDVIKYTTDITIKDRSDAYSKLTPIGKKIDGGSYLFELLDLEEFLQTEEKV